MVAWGTLPSGPPAAAQAPPGPAASEQAPLGRPFDALAEARRRVKRGERAEALRILDRRLRDAPSDDDVRVYRGIVLAGDRRYDQARAELGAVLQRNPRNTDAREASINVELWSANPGRAEELASQGLSMRAEHLPFLLARARARLQLERAEEAREDLRRILTLLPGDEQAGRLLEQAEEKLRVWQVGLHLGYSAFRDARSPWTEMGLQVGRRGRLATALFRLQRAHRYDSSSSQLELELYPKFRRGTYAYLAVAYSPEVRFYPQYRAAADLYQAIGWGLELSAGYRRLAFAIPVNGAVLGISKYWGAWLLTVRGGVSSGRTRSGSVGAHARRYLGDRGAFVGLRYGRGAVAELRNANDTAVLDSDNGGLEAEVPLGPWWLRLNGSYSRDARLTLPPLEYLTLTAGVGLRF